MWARDTVPVFVEEGGEVIGVDFNFNGWGDKQEHTNDARVGRTLLTKYGIPRVEAPSSPKAAPSRPTARAPC